MFWCYLFVNLHFNLNIFFAACSFAKGIEAAPRSPTKEEQGVQRKARPAIARLRSNLAGFAQKMKL